MVVTLGQQCNVEEKPTVILYTYINRHAGTSKRPLTNKNIVLYIPQPKPSKKTFIIVRN